MPNSPAGYVAPSPEEIRAYLTNKGWVDANGAVVGDGTQQGADNGRLIHAEAAKYGLSADQLDAAMGWDKGATDRFSAAAGMARLRGYHDLIGNNANKPPPPPTTQPPPATPNPYMQNGMDGGGDPRWGGRSGVVGPNVYSQFGGASNYSQAPNGIPPGQGYQPNPYTTQMGQNIQRQMTDNLQRNILPGIGRGAVAAGGYGGSRQGIAEGLAIGETNRGIGDALTNLYAGQYNADRNYGLQSDALDLNVYNANQNWMRQGQQDQLNLFDRMLGWNQNAYNLATGVQNTPLNYYKDFASIGQGLAGLGNQNTQNMPGNPYLGAIGGALTGYNLYNNFTKQG